MNQINTHTLNLFQPPVGIRNPHLQTVLAGLLTRGRKHKSALSREEYQLEDTDSVELVWNSLKKPEPGNRTPITLLLHGLGGSEKSHYIKRMLGTFENQGQHAAVLLFRDCGSKPNRFSESYHAGETADLAFVVAKLSEQFPDSQLRLLGYSLGANVLLKYLGESNHSEGSTVTCAVAVSVPFRLANVAAKLNRNWIFRLYQRFFLFGLRRKLKRKFNEPYSHLPPTHFNLSSALRARTLWQYDELCTAPLHGFDSARDYYNRSSCRQYLAAISVPTLILHSADDPLQTDSAIPGVGELAQNVTLEVSQYGGHVGFVTTRAAVGIKKSFLDKFRFVHWADQYIVHWLNTCPGQATQSRRLSKPTRKPIPLPCVTT